MANHPKCIYLQYLKDQEKAVSLIRRAEGSEFIKIPSAGDVLGTDTRTMQSELCSLQGDSLISTSGKLAVLDRLLNQMLAKGSRALIFSQYTLMLDVLEEYCKAKFGEVGYHRLDGSTNRTIREMNIRSFNAPGSKAKVTALREGEMHVGHWPPLVQIHNMNLEFTHIYPT